MRNFVKFFGMIALVAIVGFSVASCDNGTTGGGGGGGSGSGSSGGGGTTPRPPTFTLPAEAIGTWEATIQGVLHTVVVSSGGGWTHTAPGGWFDSGTITMTSANTGNLRSNIAQANVGTATLVNNTTLRLTLNQNTDMPGTHTFTRRR